MITGFEKITENKWKDYISACPEATIYHTPEWMHFLAKTFAYEPRYLFSLDECGDIDGMLPLMYVKSRLTKNRVECLPFSHMCVPLGKADELVAAAVSHFSPNKSSYLQINANVTHSSFLQVNSFCTHVLELNKIKEEIWKGMDRGSTRWAVNKAKKEGVIAESTCELQDLMDFYGLNCLTKKELGVPCHPYEFFKNMMRELNQMAHLYVARYNDTVIGGGIMMEYNGQVLYGYGAADSSHLKQYPYNAFVWKSIEDALEGGCKTFDFGRTSHENSGLIQFKQKWGAERKELVYSYYPGNPTSIGSNRDGTLYHFANMVIQNTPMPIYKAISNKLFKHFG